MNGVGVRDMFDWMTLSRYLTNWDKYAVEYMDMSAADVNGGVVVLISFLAIVDILKLRT